MTTYTFRTDAAHGEVIAADVDAALDQLIAENEWSADDAADIADGAWLTIFDEDGIAVLRRGTMA